MAFGILSIVVYCLLNSMPHFIYGPGEDALALTVEGGGVRDEQVIEIYLILKSLIHFFISTAIESIAGSKQQEAFVSNKR